MWSWVKIVASYGCGVDKTERGKEADGVESQERASHPLVLWGSHLFIKSVVDP